MFLSTQERDLLDFAERVARNASSYYAILFDLGRLAESACSPALVGILRFTIANFARSHGGQIYALQNERIMLVSSSEQRLSINKFILELENTLPGGREGLMDQPIEPYDISATPKLFLRCCEELYADAREAEEERLEQSRRNTSAEPAPITGRLLDQLLVSLNSCDISPMVRRQNICALMQDQQPRTLFVEYFVSMVSLSRTIAPGVSVTSNPGLFRELTRALDKRFLTLLRKEHAHYIKGPVSFNLNMTSLQSDDFLLFLDQVLPNTDKSLVVELDFMDVLDHLPDYQTIVPFLRRRGLKILVENLQPALLEMLDLSLLEADLFKIRWQKQYLANPVQKRRFLNALHTLPPNRCILTHCDSAQAVSTGQTAGLQAFQGFHVDMIAAGPAQAGTSLAERATA